MQHLHEHRYTDVTLCSDDRRFGKTDMGKAGFEEFFKTHRCNELCELLGLLKVGEIVDGEAVSIKDIVDLVEAARASLTRVRVHTHTYAHVSNVYTQSSSQCSSHQWVHINVQASMQK